jgi:DNA modification methylase
MKNLQEKSPSKLVKNGQIWQLGEHRLLVGSCTDQSLVSELLRNSQVNVIITDPPYGILYVESKAGIGEVSKNKVITNDNITNEAEYEKFSEDWLRPVLPYLSKKNSIYIFNCDKMLFALKKAMDNCGIYFSQLIVWIKNQATIARKDYAPQHELVLYGWYGTHAFRKAKDRSVIFFPKPHKSVLHPTMKPVNLVARLILNSTRVGDIVYDPFMGSGTTIVACQKTGRICYGSEIDIEYAMTSIARFEAMSKIEAVLVYEKDEI